MPENLFDVGDMSWEQRKNYNYAVAAARANGVPESVLLGILWQEGKFQTDPGGNGGGIGQMTEGTAKLLGVNRAELVKDPHKGIDASIKLLKTDYNSLGDWDKAHVAYFTGAPMIKAAEKGPGGESAWLTNLDAVIAQQKKTGVHNWETNASGYLSLTGGAINKTGGTGADPRLQTPEEILKGLGLDANGNKITTPGANGGPPTDLNKMPTIRDFQTTLPDGTVMYNYQDYQAAINGWKVYHDAQQAEKAMGIEQQSKFMDDVIDQVAKEIAVGNLSLTKANAVFNARATSYKTAVDAFNSDAFKYGAPAGAEYVPGFEPDSYAVKTLGMAPKKAQTGNFLDPMAESKAQWQLALDQYNGVSVPSVSNFSEIRGGYNPNYVPTKPNLLTNAPMIPNTPAPQNVVTNPYAMAGDIPAPAPGNTPQGFFAQAMQRVKELTNG